MDYQSLDSLLRNFTQSEKKYRNNNNNLAFFNKLERKIKNNIECFILDNYRNQSPKIHLSKQSRFCAVPMHVHKWIELNYMYSGSCVQRINHTSYELKEGQIILIDKDTPHAISKAGNDDILINIVIPEEYLSPQFLSRLSTGIVSNFFVHAIDTQKNHDNFIIFNTIKSRRIHVFLKELMCEYFKPSLNSAEIIENYLVLIFLELINEYESNSNFNSHNQKQSEHLIPILRYIEENFKTCTLEATALNFNLHPNYLTGLLKKLTGMSYTELVQEQRLNYATTLLKTTKMSINLIASEVGYDNISFFYKKFKAKYNCTPSEYRQKTII